ncbi:MAG: hypothetical protein R3251_00830 [Candidatus Spechtbacterales bacterium]|nr:hypothetical protein [Candidatus Spechtbacterales bacterium]
MIKGPKQILIISVIALIIGAMFFSFRGPEGEADITIEAELDKSTYTSDEPINLTLHLNNTGELDACISDMAGETLVFNSLTRNGEMVNTRRVDANYLAPLPMLLEASLEDLPVGGDTHVVLSSEHDSGLDARAFTTTELEGDTGFITFYDISEPGEYNLELVYQYPGPDSENCENVFFGPSNVQNITFTVSE